MKMLQLSKFFSTARDCRKGFYNVRITPEVQTIIDQCNAMKASVPAWTKTDLAFQNQLNDRIKYEFTYHSNALEGNTLSCSESVFFIGEGLTVSGKPLKDFLETRNHCHAVDLLLTEVENDNEFSTNIIRVMNEILLYGIDFTEKENAGKYKLLPNYVILRDGTRHEFVDPSQVEQQMDELRSSLNW